MKHRIILVAAMLCVAVGLSTASAFAQEIQPPNLWHREQIQSEDARSADAVHPVSSERYLADQTRIPLDSRKEISATVVPAATGGPDDFGYTWTDNVPLSWIDAFNGIDTGLNSSISTAGPFNIGFTFGFYENSYSQLWVSRHGFIGFSSDALSNSQSEIPSPERPNDVIAPHWVPSDGVNYVRYLRGGTAPNRWFVMEWNGLNSNYDTPENYTFEVVLYENGTIVFQYAEMNVTGNYYCQSSGIEDNTGIDGLAASRYCRQIPGYRAVRISRPGPAARIKVFPQHYGKLTSPGAQVMIAIPVINSGDLGQDTFDITVSSRWAVGLYQSNGITPLVDTDGDGIPDTGPLASGARTTIIAKVSVPPTSSVGNSNQSLLTFRSSRNVAKQRSATLRTAIPAQFAQVFRDASDNAMNMYLVRPGHQQLSTVTGSPYDGYDLSVVESGNSNLVYAWTRGRCITNPCSIVVYEIEYGIFDRNGNLVRPVDKLTDHSSVTLSTYDFNLALAVAPDRRIGVLWARELHDSATGRWNDNVFYALLSPAGQLLHGPINLTNNAQWSGDQGAPAFYDLRIEATGDNRFFVAWTREHQEAGGYVDDIWYSVWTSSGANVRPNTRLTNDTPGWDDYYESPSLTAVPGNRVLMFLERQGDVYSAVFSSDGSVVRAFDRLTSDGLNWGRIDSVRTSHGNFVAAWTGQVPYRPGQQPWTARYFNNETLSGAPVLTRTDNVISFNWEEGSPHPLVNADFFSVRWEGTITVPAGKYLFEMGSDDGSRLWIDDQLVMDYWDQCCQYWSTTVDLTAGAHQVRMEMHEHDGAAWAYLGWQELTGAVIRYAVLDPSFRRVAGPVALTNDADLLGEDAVSVTADADGSAILTWMDDYSYYPNLYYALVDGDNGNVLTAPMIYWTSPASTPYVFTSYQGNGNTTLGAQPWRVYLPLISQPRDVCEPNNGRSEARCPLRSGVTYRAYISSPGEWDFYHIDVPTDHVIEVWLQQIPAGHDYDLYLYDVTGTRIGFSGNIGNADEHIRTADQMAGGRYLVAVKGQAGSGLTQPYALKSVFR